MIMETLWAGGVAPKHLSQDMVQLMLLQTLIKSFPVESCCIWFCRNTLHSARAGTAANVDTLSAQLSLTNQVA